jgi:hypothetical protein
MSNLNKLNEGETILISFDDIKSYLIENEGFDVDNQKIKKAKLTKDGLIIFIENN